MRMVDSNLDVKQNDKNGVQPLGPPRSPGDPPVE